MWIGVLVEGYTECNNGILYAQIVHGSFNGKAFKIYLMLLFLHDIPPPLHCRQIYQNMRFIYKTPKSSRCFSFLYFHFILFCMLKFIQIFFRNYFLKYSSLHSAIPFYAHSWLFSTGPF